MKRLLVLLGVLLSLAAARAQGFSGTYTMATETGGVTLVLQQSAQGEVTGTLSGNGSSFALEGVLDDLDQSVAYGTVAGPEGVLAFEATLEQGGLYLVLVGLTPQGELDESNVSEFFFERAAEAGSGNAGDAPLEQSAPSNPLGARSGNPLAQQEQPDLFAGTFTGEGLTLSLEPAEEQYAGQLEFGGNRYEVVAVADGDTLTGGFQVAGDTFTFTATLAGATLTLSSDGASYRLQKQGGAANPLAGGAANPAGGSQGSSSPVLAQGQHASLTQDSALAFIEALEFSLEQVGYAYTFSEAERQQMFQEMVRAYPQASQEEQVIMASAREIWDETQAGWPSASDEDKRAFILAVFVLAFGEETVQQWVGPGGSGGQGQALGGSQCSSFEDCTSSFVDESTWTDTFNTQSCWASAGCGGYDTSTDTFYYDEP